MVPDMVPDVDFMPYSVDSIQEKSAQGQDVVISMEESSFEIPADTDNYNSYEEQRQPVATNNYYAGKGESQTADTEKYYTAEGDEQNEQEPELLLFTTMYKSEEKVGVLDSLFNLWKSWSPAIKPLVFTSDPEIETDATKHGWPWLPETKNPDCYGPPLFPNMFIDAMDNYDASFYCYANSDIVFDNGLLQTIRAMAKNKTLLERPFVLVGKRIYFDFEKYGHLMKTADDVSYLANTGEEIHWSSDYWVTTKRFPWHEVLPISVGRPLFCRWIIAYAIENKITVIDTSQTIKAVHLTTQDGNRSSWVKPGNDCNARIIMYGEPQIKQMRLGLVECAELETYFDENGEIKIRSRLPDAKECPAYYRPDLPAVWFKAWNLTMP